MNIFENILNLFISPRFISFYWTAGLTFAVDLVGLISPSIPDLGLPQWIAILVVGGLAQLTKALNNYRQGKKMGFAPKE